MVCADVDRGGQDSCPVIPRIPRRFARSRMFVLRYSALSCCVRTGRRFHEVLRACKDPSDRQQRRRTRFQTDPMIRAICRLPCRHSGRAGSREGFSRRVSGDWLCDAGKGTVGFIGDSARIAACRYDQGCQTKARVVPPLARREVFFRVDASAGFWQALYCIHLIRFWRYCIQFYLLSGL